MALNYQIIFHNENELQKYVCIHKITKQNSYNILIIYEITQFLNLAMLGANLPQLRCAGQLVRTKANTIPYMTVILVRLLCAELSCYCCNQLASVAKLCTNITAEHP